jgi:hypothetical protein
MRRIASGAVVLAIDAQAARRGDRLLPAAAVVGGKLRQRMPGNGAVERSCEGARLAGGRADCPTYMDDIVGLLMAFERERHVAQTPILQIGLDLES